MTSGNSESGKDSPIITVPGQQAGADESEEEHLFEKLFDAIKGELEDIDELSVGELLAAQCLIVNGISHTLSQIAGIQMSQQAEGSFTDIKKQMAIAEFQKHLFQLDVKLNLLVQEVDKKLLRK
jgi:hypothetical protein